MRRLYILLIPLALFYSCDIVNPSETIPAYIDIESSIITATGTQGAATSNITNISVTSGGNDLGVYELPTNFPILEEGETEVIVLPSVQVNGRSQFIKPYPFYEAIVKNLNLVPGESTDMQINTKYRTSTKFAFIEDFELGVNVFFTDADVDKETNVQIIEDARSGLNAGIFILNDDHPIMEVASPEIPGILNFKRDVYLELDYKNDVDITVFALVRSTAGGSTRVELSSLRPREDWNKVYFILSDEVRLTGIAGISIIISAQIRDGDVSPAEVSLDNIKLVWE